MSFVIASITPDSLSTFIERNNPRSVGKIFTMICNPSFAPSTKTSKIACFSIKP